MEERIEKFEDGRYAMPLSSKERPLLPDSQRKSLKDSKYEDYLKFTKEICNRAVSWDEPLPEEVRSRWERWKCDVLHLNESQIPRYFQPKTLSGRKTITKRSSLHGRCGVDY